MSDSSFFNLGDVGSALGSFIKDTGSVFTGQILKAGENKAVSFSQSIINGLSKATQSTSNMLGLTHTGQMTKTAPDISGEKQVTAYKLLGVNLTQTQLILVAATGGILLIGILVWMSTRS